MPDTREMPDPLCGECQEFHQPREPCEECGAKCGECFIGCSDYDYYAPDEEM